ncbi:MAG: lysine--tRNA ligase [Candidatus Cloacimonetes bacterium]|nr:lysine--tRNA ligase [Candidatus Cloacimonadota bacterium]
MQNENLILKQRREKLQKIIDLGVNPYPNRVNRTHKISDLILDKEQYLKEETSVIIAGRIVAFRRQGKIAFVNIEDDSAKIQLFVKKDVIGENNYEVFKLFDLGDIVQAEGITFITQTGEFSLKTTQITLLSKNIKPIPTVKEKIVEGKTVRYDEFSDIETRFRKRYLDILLNPSHKKTFELRAMIISEIRKVLNNKQFLEVETPVMQPLYGGANARPFVTHHNTLDVDLYLRIATELYLKRLIIGGFERVYEIGKNFRNEGMDKTHNPEFTAIEIYQAFADIEDMMQLTEEIFTNCAKIVSNDSKITYDEIEINLNSPWHRATMVDLVKEYTGFDASELDKTKLINFYEMKKIPYDKNWGPGRLLTELFDLYVEEKLIQPTFVLDYPKEVSPLAKSKPDSELFVERFELFIGGHEYANAFTELNDPLDQRARLESQAELRALGDLEANVVDEDFLEALEYGMPPTGGLGIGIDRMIMLLTNNNSIKEVILFPQMKPESL